MYVFFYSQEMKIAATWKTGQMTHFSSQGVNEGIHDGEMMESFEFISWTEEK